jgi:hypothetical protein
MTKYEIGDKVRVREDLNSNDIYAMEDDTHYKETATDSMVKLHGQVVTICGVYKGGYCVYEDESKFNWTDEMFEPCMAKYHVNDIVRIRKDLTEIETGILIEDLNSLKGTYASITSVEPATLDDECGYYLDNNNYIWSESWIEPVELVEADKPSNDKNVAKDKKDPSNDLEAWLTTGRIGKMKDGNLFIIVHDKVIYRIAGWDYLKDVKDDIKYLYSEAVKGFEPFSKDQIVYDGTKKKMTLEEIEEILGYKVEIC